MCVRCGKGSVPCSIPWLGLLILIGLFPGYNPARAQVLLPDLATGQLIKLSSDSATRWREEKYEVLWLPASCTIQQGPRTIQGSSAILWINHADDFSLAPHEVIAYVQDAVVTHHTEKRGQPAIVERAPNWLGNLESHQHVFYAFRHMTTGRPEPLPPIYGAAMQARTPKIDPTFGGTLAPGIVSAIAEATRPSQVQQAQFNGPASGGPSLKDRPIQPGTSGVLGTNISGALLGPTSAPLVTPDGPRRIRIFPRSNVRMHSDSFVSPDGNERVTLIDSGVNILIEGGSQLGTVDIATDRAVIWSPAGSGDLGLKEGQPAQDAAGMALEFYLEGNIVFRQGDRVIYATSMYYNVQREMGVILEAEMLAGVPNYPGMVRLRADVLRQIDRGHYHAHQAALTTSRMGIPRYWFQSGDVTFEDKHEPVVDPATGAPLIDPLTGQPVMDHQRLATSRNNTVYIGEIPVFHWPRLSTDLTRPTTFVNRVRLKSDRVFGTQIGLGVDVERLLGIGDDPNADWSFNVDWMSDRGWGLGTNYDYVLDKFLFVPGESRGFIDAWGINDNGLDNLGLDRRALTPEEDYRGRVLWQHRQRTESGWQITGEVGYVSDRNFLEQYYEREWDQWKDQTTGVEFKRLLNHHSLNLSADVRLNDFFTQTEWLPRLDHFQFGQAPASSFATWFGHTHVGYGKLKPASAPEDLVDAAKFNPLPWEVEAEGLRAGGQYEIDIPFQAGPVKIVPFGSGAVTYWDETLDGSDQTRLLGQAGIRASLPMWRIDRECQNILFNVNGLAHKVVWEAEFLWADADKNFEDLALYDPLDDDAIEHFRRRFRDDAFGGLPNINDNIPFRFDERQFAFRSGIQRWVSSPTVEIADDLVQLRAGVRQRWQTKRGLPGYQRTVDWMTLDVGGTWFPKANRDNFGEDFGMLNYDWRWHVGDRVTLMSDGYVDTFGDGLRMFTVGSYISRPERGSAYLGFRSIEGPISSNVLNAAVSYRMSQKWIAAAGAVIDFGSAGNIGQVFELTRIGESFLVSVGANIDASRNNLGFGVSVVPRFLPLTYRGRVGGVPIAPAGAFGLE